MLKNNHLLTINLAREALVRHGEAELASALNDVVNEEIGARVATTDRAARAKASGASLGGRPPKHVYAVELEPGWYGRAAGSAKAHDMLNDALTELGAVDMLPTKASFGVLLSRGPWMRRVETPNGTVTVTVRRETGTNPA